MGRPQLPNPQRDQRTQDWLADPTVFTSAVFDCFLDTRSLKFTSKGSLLFTLEVPAGQIEQALPVRHLVRQKLPLTVELRASDRFTSLRDKQAARLSVVDDEDE